MICHNFKVIGVCDGPENNLEYSDIYFFLGAHEIPPHLRFVAVWAKQLL
jgi:hypothetical protein